MMSNPLVLICIRDLSDALGNRRVMLSSAFTVVWVGFAFGMIPNSQPSSGFGHGALIWCEFLAMLPAVLSAPISISLTTGERERATLETTLSFCPERSTLALGKTLAIAVCYIAHLAGVIVALVSAVAFNSFGSHESPLPHQEDRFGALVYCFTLMAVFFCAWFSSMAFLLGYLARSVREASSWLNPILLAVMVLPSAAAYWGFLDYFLLLLVPGIGVYAICFEILDDRFVWWHCAVVAGSTGAYCWLAIHLGIRRLCSDSMLVRY